MQQFFVLVSLETAPFNYIRDACLIFFLRQTFLYHFIIRLCHKTVISVRLPICVLLRRFSQKYNSNLAILIS